MKNNPKKYGSTDWGIGLELDTDKFLKEIKQLKMMRCPNCHIELSETNFKAAMMIDGENRFWCPECGHEWEINDANRRPE